MPKTVANQKWIRVHKSPLVYNFLSVPNNEWMTANKTLTPYGLQLYLYLAANMDGYQFALSPEDAERTAGIRRTTFYEYLRKMEIHGYLVWRGGNTYDFYTSPRPEDKRTHPDKHASGLYLMIVRAMNRHSSRSKRRIRTAKMAIRWQSQFVRTGI